MTIKSSLLAAFAVAALASCATRESMPVATATDCFYPACVIDVEVIETSGVRTLKVKNGGNVRMGTRHRLTAIVWNLQTPGYEFRGNSVRPGSGYEAVAAWDSQIIGHNWNLYSVSVTDMNTVPGVLRYELTVYPDRSLGGGPLTAAYVIANDPGPHPQRRQ